MPATAQPAGDNPLDHALALVDQGLRPVPIRPGGKNPPMKSWQHAHPTPDSVRNWWTNLYRDCGVGLVMGPQDNGVYLMALDIDAHDPLNDGWDALADLEKAYGELPDTWRSLTGGGGAHILFSVPAGIVVRNQQAGGNRIAPGIDVRGDGGQIVVAPSVHPKTGQAYAWEFAPWDTPLAECPAWLLELVRERPVEVDRTTLAPARDLGLNGNSPDSPADALRSRWDWRSELTAAGWTLAKEGDDSFWTRPGKNPRDGHSAVLHGNEVLVVFTTEVPTSWTQVGRRTADGSGWSFSPFAFYAAVNHGGDMQAAGRALRVGDVDFGTYATTFEAGEYQKTSFNPETSVDDDWTPRDLAEIAQGILDGTLQPELPELVHVDGGIPLIYPGRVHSVFGTPGGGKSWVGVYAVLEVVQAGLRAAYIDWEDSPRGFTARMIELGATLDDIARVDYYNPATSLLMGMAAIEAEMEGWTLAVIDSTGEAMAAGGVKANEDDAVAMWMGLVKRIARTGAAVILIDHVAKNPDNRDMEIGSQRKQAGITGAAYRVDTIIEPAKGRDGKIKLVVRKDRLGNRAKGSTACEVAFLSSGDRLELKFTVSEAQAAAERGEKFRPTHLMERVSRFVEINPGASRHTIETSVEGKAKSLRTAIEVLIEEGWIEVNKVGQTFEHRSVRAFREADEAADNLVITQPRPTSSHLVPTSSRTRSNTPETNLVPLVPVLLEDGDEGRGSGMVPKDEPRPPATSSPLWSVNPITGDPEF